MQCVGEKYKEEISFFFPLNRKKMKKKNGKMYRSLKACPTTIRMNIFSKRIVTIYHHYALQGFSSLGWLPAVLTTNLSKILKDM